MYKLINNFFFSLIIQSICTNQSVIHFDLRPPGTDG